MKPLVVEKYCESTEQEISKMAKHFSLSSSSGNRTPGSRSYSDLVDTWADSVCIYQLLLRPCS